MAVNGTSPAETESALVVWVNSFTLSTHVHSLSETNDGQAFWEMLCEINPTSFTEGLPSREQSEYAREQNLHFIYDQLSAYLDEQGAIYKPLNHEDVRTIASDGSTSSVSKACVANIPTTALRTNTVKLLKLILLVLLTPPNAEVINKISTLPQRTQKVLETLFREIDPSQSPSDDEDTQEMSDIDSDQTWLQAGANHSQSPKVGRELELEAQLAEVQSKLDRRNRVMEKLGAEKEDLSEAFNRLRESYEAIRRQAEEQDDQIGKLASGHINRDQALIRELEAKISHQEEVISCHKIQISEQGAKQAELQRKLEKLNTTAEDFQKLQDDFHIQKKDLEQQTKKANASEKYKQKLLSSQVIEKERDTLRQQVDEALPIVKAYEEIRRDNARLAKENRETISTLEQSERGNSELRETKQVIVAENKRLQRELRAMRDSYAHVQERVADFEDRSSGSDVPTSPTVVDGGLDSELAATFKQEEQLQVASTLLAWARKLMNDRKSRIAELERHNQELVSDANEKDIRATILQEQLDSAHNLSADQLVKESRLHQDISSLESSILELCQGHPLEGSVLPVPSLVDLAHNCESTETFMRMRDQFKEEKVKNKQLLERLSTAQKDIEAATSDCTSTFEVHCMMSDLNIDLLEGELAGKPKLEIVEEVKKQCSGALVQLQSEYNILNKRHFRLQEEFNRQREERNQAWCESHEAVVAKAEEETKTAANNRSFMEMTEMILQATANNSPESRICVEKVVEGTREREAKAQQIINQQNALIKDLEARLNHQAANGKFRPSFDHAATVIKSVPQAVPSRDEVAYTQNLERELQLMASAYHDLAGRLQMNNVILQRRAEAPKSWLGRQRKAMEGVSGLMR